MVLNVTPGCSSSYNGNNEYGLGQLAEFIKQWISIEAQQP